MEIEVLKIDYKQGMEFENLAWIFFIEVNYLIVSARFNNKSIVHWSRNKGERDFRRYETNNNAMIDFLARS